MWHYTWKNRGSLVLVCLFSGLVVGAFGCGEWFPRVEGEDDGNPDNTVHESPPDECDAEGVYFTSPQLSSVGVGSPVAVDARVDVHAHRCVDGQSEPVGPIDRIELRDGSAFEMVGVSENVMTFEAVASGTSEFALLPSTVEDPDSSFEMRAEPIAEVEFDYECGLTSTLESEFEQFDLDEALISESYYDTSLLFDGPEGETLSGYHLHPDEFVDVFPEDAVRWDFEMGEEELVDGLTVESGVDHLRIEYPGPGSPAEFSVVESSDELQISLFRLGKPYYEYEEGEEVEYSTFAPGESNTLHVEDDAEYAFVARSHADQAQFCDPGGSESLFVAEFRLRTETPQVCKVGHFGVLGDDVEPVESLTSSLPVLLLPRTPGECTISVEMLEGELYGETASWTWNVEE